LLSGTRTRTNTTELLDELLKGFGRPEDLRGVARLMKTLQITVIARTLSPEMAKRPSFGGPTGAMARPVSGPFVRMQRCRFWRPAIGVLGTARIACRAMVGSFDPALVKKAPTCTVHLVRHAQNFYAWKCRKAATADLRRI
jgi:hypothetical protein